jgi:hypothetical protein
VTLLGLSIDRTHIRSWIRRPADSSWIAVFGLAAMAVVAAGVFGGKYGLLALGALAVAVPLLGALRRRPQRGVIVLVALAPFDGLRLILPLPSSAGDWKEALVLAVLGATFLAPAEARAAKDRRRYPPWLPAVAGLIALGLGSAVLVGGQQALTGFRIDYFYVLLGIAVWRCPLSERERDRLVSVLMVTGFLTAVWGIGQQVLGQARLNSMGYQYNTTIVTTHGFLRSFSTLASNFEFAFFLMVVLLVGLPCALSDTRRRRNKMFLLSLPVYGVALVLTFTRGAWLGVAVGGLYLGIRRHRVMLLALPALILVLFLLPGSIISTSSSTTSLGERTTGWLQNFDQVIAHPFGVGIGATGAAAQKVAELQAQAQAIGRGSSALLDINTSIPGSSVYQPDNYYYKTVYELGLPGLWLWLLLLGSSFLFAARLARSTSGTESSVALGVAAFVLAAMACSFVATFFEDYPMDLFFWLLIWMTVSGHPVSDVARRDPLQLPSSIGARLSPSPSHGTP